MPRKNTFQHEFNAQSEAIQRRASYSNFLNRDFSDSEWLQIQRFIDESRDLLMFLEGAVNMEKSKEAKHCIEALNKEFSAVYDLYRKTGFGGAK